MTPAGTSNELDVQNEWEENTLTHTHTNRVPLFSIINRVPGSNWLARIMSRFRVPNELHSGLVPADSSRMSYTSGIGLAYVRPMADYLR